MNTVLVPGEAFLIGEVSLYLVAAAPGRAMFRIVTPDGQEVILLEADEAAALENQREEFAEGSLLPLPERTSA